MLKKGGMKPKAFVEDEINAIVEWIEDDCGLTLKQVKEKVLANFRKNVSASTIGNYLKGSLFTMNQVHKQPISMNSEENKRKRAEYVAALNNSI
jgi:transposase